MARYKVPQDIETEDKLVGPLSLRQLIFAIIFFALIWFGWLVFGIMPFLAIFFLPGIVLFGILAFVPNRDQPSEVYLASLLRFITVPRRKIWSQDGLVETVHVVVPKVEKKQYTDERNRGEVGSQLKNLAQLMDTRGWASKDPTVNDPGSRVSQHVSDNRLIGADKLPKAKGLSTVLKEGLEISQKDDLNQPENPTNDSFKQMIDDGEETRIDTIKGQLTEQISSSEETLDPIQPPDMIVTPDVEKKSPKKDTSEMTSTLSPAIVDLASKKDENLMVSDVARRAEEETSSEGIIEQGEGEISLH